MKSLSRTSAENKKSSQYNQFCKMQLDEEYADQTLAMNKIQEYVLTNWLKLLEVERSFS
jgi:hypothetical protein